MQRGRLAVNAHVGHMAAGTDEPGAEFEGSGTPTASIVTSAPSPSVICRSPPPHPHVRC